MSCKNFVTSISFSYPAQIRAIFFLHISLVFHFFVPFQQGSVEYAQLNLDTAHHVDHVDHVDPGDPSGHVDHGNQGDHSAQDDHMDEIDNSADTNTAVHGE